MEQFVIMITTPAEVVYMYSGKPYSENMQLDKVRATVFQNEAEVLETMANLHNSRLANNWRNKGQKYQIVSVKVTVTDEDVERG